MIAAHQIVQHLLEDEEPEYFDWKEVTTDLPLALEMAGFKASPYERMWTFNVNPSMEIHVRIQDDGQWYGNVTFEGVGTLSEFMGSDIEMARWLEAKERWPKKHFSDWNRFKAAAMGKTIREDEEEDKDIWKEVCPGPPIASMQSSFDGDTTWYALYINGEHHSNHWSSNSVIREAEKLGAVWPQGPPVLSVFWPRMQNEAEEDDFSDVTRSSAEDWLHQAGYEFGGGAWHKSWRHQGMHMIARESEGGKWEVHCRFGGGTLWSKLCTEEELKNMLYRTSLKIRFRESEEDEVGWKDVTPNVAAAEVQRWCFTDFELKNPGLLRLRTAEDEFLADGSTELAVVVYRNGTVTNRWEDGTVGVPKHVAELADMDESPIKPIWNQMATREDDHYADNWRDVYVHKSGLFLGFVSKHGTMEALDDEFETKELASEPYNLYSPVKPAEPMTAPFRVVLHGSSRDREWVTHLQNMEDNSFFWGHYFHGNDGYTEAVQDFKERCDKYGIDSSQAERVLKESEDDSFDFGDVEYARFEDFLISHGFENTGNFYIKTRDDLVYSAFFNNGAWHVDVSRQVGQGEDFRYKFVNQWVRKFSDINSFAEFLRGLKLIDESEEDDAELWKQIMPNPDRYGAGGWVEQITAGPTTYVRRKWYKDQPAEDRWQRIIWSDEDKGWRLEDTGIGVLEGEWEEVLEKADDLWTER